MQGKAKTICAKCIRQQDVGARINVALMNASNQIRMLDIPKFPRESIPKAELKKISSHCAIGNDNFLLIKQAG